jgi:hypothetical protein
MPSKDSWARCNRELPGPKVRTVAQPKVHIRLRINSSIGKTGLDNYATTTLKPYENIKSKLIKIGDGERSGKLHQGILGSLWIRIHLWTGCRTEREQPKWTPQPRGRCVMPPSDWATWVVPPPCCKAITVAHVRTVCVRLTPRSSPARLGGDKGSGGDNGSGASVSASDEGTFFLPAGVWARSATSADEAARGAVAGGDAAQPRRDVHLRREQLPERGVAAQGRLGGHLVSEDKDIRDRGGQGRRRGRIGEERASRFERRRASPGPPGADHSAPL